MSKLTKEISRFLIAGISAVGTDLTSYYIMINFLNNDIAKTFLFLWAAWLHLSLISIGLLKDMKKVMLKQLNL